MDGGADTLLAPVAEDKIPHASGEDSNEELPPSPSRQSISLEEQMAQLMSMSNKASDMKATNSEKSLKTGKAMHRQRIRSRELEKQLFGGLLKADHDKIHDVFTEIDTDNSGTLEASELRQALEKSGKTCTDQQVRRPRPSLGMLHLTLTPFALCLLCAAREAPRRVLQLQACEERGARAELQGLREANRLSQPHPDCRRVKRLRRSSAGISDVCMSMCMLPAGVRRRRTRRGRRRSAAARRIHTTRDT